VALLYLRDAHHEVAGALRAGLRVDVGAVRKLDDAVAHRVVEKRLTHPLLQDGAFELHLGGLGGAVARVGWWMGDDGVNCVV